LHGRANNSALKSWMSRLRSRREVRTAPSDLFSPTRRRSTVDPARQQDSPCLRLHRDPWLNLSAIRVLPGASSWPSRSPYVCDVSQNVRTCSKAERCVGKVLRPRRKGRQFAYFVMVRASALASCLSEADGLPGQRTGDKAAEGRCHPEELGDGTSARSAKS
jgi:hypothetical protein